MQLPILLALARRRSVHVVMTNKQTTTLLDIAKQHLELDTLDARRSDSLDFHEFSVWQVRAALEAAYRAGAARVVRSVRVFGTDGADALKTADAAYQDRIVKARTLLVTVGALLDHHVEDQRKDPESWALVGDLGELNKKLGEAAVCITPDI